MFRGFYLVRWQQHAAVVGRSLKEKTPIDAKTFEADLRQWMRDWSSQENTYSVKTKGDSVALAKKLYAKYIEPANKVKTGKK